MDYSNYTQHTEFATVFHEVLKKQVKNKNVSIDVTMQLIKNNLNFLNASYTSFIEKLKQKAIKQNVNESVVKKITELEDSIIYGSSLNDLPNELKNVIFSFLNLQGATSMAQTDTQAASFFKNSPKIALKLLNQNIHLFPANKAVDWAIHCGELVTDLNLSKTQMISKLEEEDINKLVKACPNLKTLNLGGDCSEISSRFVQNLRGKGINVTFVEAKVKDPYQFWGWT